MPPSSSLAVPATLDRLPQIRDFVLDAAVASGFLPKRLPALELLLEEAAVNVISHAYGGSSGSMEVTWSVEKDGFVLEIADQGTPFDPTTATDPDTTLPLEERTCGGLGLLFIRRSCDRLSWRREGERNVLTCRFDFPPESPGVP